MDDSKLCKALVTHFPVPVEITQFSHEHVIRTVGTLPVAKGCKPILRSTTGQASQCDFDQSWPRRGDCSNNKLEPGEPPAVTDNNNYIVDLHFEKDLVDGSIDALASQAL